MGRTIDLMMSTARALDAESGYLYEIPAAHVYDILASVARVARDCRPELDADSEISLRLGVPASRAVEALAQPHRLNGLACAGLGVLQYIDSSTRTLRTRRCMREVENLLQMDFLDWPFAVIGDDEIMRECADVSKSH